MEQTTHLKIQGQLIRIIFLRGVEVIVHHGQADQGKLAVYGQVLLWNGATTGR